MNQQEVRAAMVRAIENLRRAAPMEFKTFVEACRMQADVAKNECVKATAEEVHVAQGRARQAIEFVLLMDNAEKTAARMSNKAGS